MGDVSELARRIDGAFAAVKQKAQQQTQQRLQEFQGRQALLKEYEKAQARIVEIARPRLEALAKRAGERAKVTPAVSQTRRAATFEFKSAKARIVLTFSVAPDQEVKRAVVEYELKVVPVLWKFDSHAEFGTPVANVDADGLTKWLDDRILSFVDLFIEIHEGELFDQAEVRRRGQSGARREDVFLHRRKQQSRVRQEGCRERVSATRARPVDSPP
jgi:hypothetical protein